MLAHFAVVLPPCALFYAALWRYHRTAPAPWLCHLVAVAWVASVTAALRISIATLFPVRYELQHPAVWGGVIPLVLALAAVVVVMGATGMLSRPPLPEGPQMQVSGIARGMVSKPQGMQEVAAAILVVGAIVVVGALVFGLIAAWLVR